MKRFFTALFLIFFTHHTQAQEIVNLVMVGDHGITENVKEAHSFIVIKKYPGSFQRLEYRMHAPLRKLKSYSDSTLSVLQGEYYDYDEYGNMKTRGQYENNLKQDTWYIYNDTGKIILYEEYEKGVVVKITDPDTIKKEEKIDNITSVGTEAAFSKKAGAWMKFLTNNLHADLAQQSLKGGKVVAEFVVDTLGRCTNVHLFRSVEFILDEEVLRVIEKSPLWDQPGILDGRKVKAYRRQPVTFSKQ